MNNITWITENLSDHSSIMDGYIKGRLSFGINDYSDVVGQGGIKYKYSLRMIERFSVYDIYDDIWESDSIQELKDIAETVFKDYVSEIKIWV
jgi:predicted transcriptional regulator